MKRSWFHGSTLALLALLFSALLTLPKPLVADTGADSGAPSPAVKQEAPAQDLSNAELVKTVSALNKRVEELETKLAEKAAPVAESDRLKLLEDRLSAQEKISSTAAGGGLNLDNLPSGNFLKNTKITGFVDTSYTFNFNQPQGLSNNSNGVPGSVPPIQAAVTPVNLHAFDRGSNDFTVNLVQLQFNKDPDPVGYNVKLAFGNDAEVFGAAENLSLLNNTQNLNTAGNVSAIHGDLFDLEQAYIVYKFPMEKIVQRWKCLDGLTGNIQAGKYVTMAGAEVIESKDNWNFSRSFLFSLAIPFTHTGVRTNWNYKGWLDTSFGVNNGWDVFDDNNQAKTLESKIGVTPTDWASASLVHMFGSETTQKSGNTRNLLDLVATIKNPWKQIEALNKLTLMFNMDWAREENIATFNVGTSATTPPLNEARWHGYAGYAKYDLFPWWSLGMRGEYFQDTDGARTGRQQDLWETTITNQFNLFNNLITRLEYRHDAADKEIFGTAQTGSNNNGFYRSYQDIMYLEAIYSF